MSNCFLADNNGAPHGQCGDALDTARHCSGPQLPADTTDARWGLLLAGSGDFHMATDSVATTARNCRSTRGHSGVADGLGAKPDTCGCQSRSLRCVELVLVFVKEIPRGRGAERARASPG
jgi:hypothetical protein